MSYKLVEIDKKYYDSIKEYRDEMLKTSSSFDGCSSLEKFENIEKWHYHTLLFQSEDTVPPSYSIGFQYIYVNNNKVVGMIQIRPDALNHKYLKEFGGHIGYSVIPSERKKGIATRMLRDALSICKNKFKLDKVLITCDFDNEGSKKVILNNNGIYEKDIYYSPHSKNIERYWIYL